MPPLPPGKMPGAEHPTSSQEPSGGHQRRPAESSMLLSFQSRPENIDSPTRQLCGGARHGGKPLRRKALSPPPRTGKAPVGGRAIVEDTSPPPRAGRARWPEKNLHAQTASRLSGCCFLAQETGDSSLPIAHAPSPLRIKTRAGVEGSASARCVQGGALSEGVGKGAKASAIE